MPIYIHFKYVADGPKDPGWGKTRPSIHMPREFCRIRLKIKSIGCERLHDITEESAIAEGIESYIYSGRTSYYAYKDYLNRPVETEDDILTPTESFKSLWIFINGLESWVLNPWVWVLKFELIA